MLRIRIESSLRKDEIAFLIRTSPGYRKNRCVRAAGFGFCGWLKATPVATPVRRRSRSGFGTVSGRGPLKQQHGGFAGFEFPGRRSIFRGRGSIFARPGTDFVAGAEFSQCQVHISWQGQHFRRVKNIFRGRAAISQGEVQISLRCSDFAR